MIYILKNFIKLLPVVASKEPAEKLEKACHISDTTIGCKVEPIRAGASSEKTKPVRTTNVNVVEEKRSPQVYKESLLKVEKH